MKKIILILTICLTMSLYSTEETKVVEYEINDYTRFSLSSPSEGSRSIANQYDLKKEMKEQMKDESLDFDNPFSPPNEERSMQFWKFNQKL